MINIKQILKTCECMNCKRNVPFTLKYSINNVEIELCEDCSNALSNLHYACMESGKSYKYDKDDKDEIVPK